MENMHESLIDLIERSGVAFCRDGGITSSAIDNAEARLGIPLPDSYKWWLRKYGAGQIEGDILFGLDEGDIDMANIVGLAEQNARHGFHGKERLVFCVGNEEQFYFDTINLVDGEYKVFWLEFGQDPMLFAADFAGFLKRRIREVYRL